MCTEYNAPYFKDKGGQFIYNDDWRSKVVESWSELDVYNWLTSSSKLTFIAIDQLPYENFRSLTGKQLIKFKVSDFVEKDTKNGVFLYLYLNDIISHHKGKACRNEFIPAVTGTISTFEPSISQLSDDRGSPVYTNAWQTKTLSDWSCMDVYFWLVHICKENQIPLDKFPFSEFQNFDGMRLLLLSGNDYSKKTKEYGVFIYKCVNQLVLTNSNTEPLTPTPKILPLDEYVPNNTTIHPPSRSETITSLESNHHPQPAPSLHPPNYHHLHPHYEHTNEYNHNQPLTTLPNILSTSPNNQQSTLLNIDSHQSTNIGHTQHEPISTNQFDINEHHQAYHHSDNHNRVISEYEEFMDYNKIKYENETYNANTNLDMSLSAINTYDNNITLNNGNDYIDLNISMMNNDSKLNNTSNTSHKTVQIENLNEIYYNIDSVHNKTIIPSTTSFNSSNKLNIPTSSETSSSSLTTTSSSNDFHSKYVDFTKNCKLNNNNISTYDGYINNKNNNYYSNKIQHNDFILNKISQDVIKSSKSSGYINIHSNSLKNKINKNEQDETIIINPINRISNYTHDNDLKNNTNRLSDNIITNLDKHKTTTNGESIKKQNKDRNNVKETTTRVIKTINKNNEPGKQSTSKNEKVKVQGESSKKSTFEDIDNNVLSNIEETKYPKNGIPLSILTAYHDGKIKMKITKVSDSNSWRNKSIKQWSQIDVKNWLTHISPGIGLPAHKFPFHLFPEDLNGRKFLEMKKSDFTSKYKKLGEAIYCKLEELIVKENCDEYNDGSGTSSDRPFSSSPGETTGGDNSYLSGSDDDDEDDNNSDDIEEERTTSTRSIQQPSTSSSESTTPRRRPGRPKGVTNKKVKKKEKLGKVWQFLISLLHNKEYNPSLICWESYNEGKFRFIQSDKVAALWGDTKQNETYNYEKFSRAMRYYYKHDILRSVDGRLIYQFGANAVGWKTDNPIPALDRSHTNISQKYKLPVTSSWDTYNKKNNEPESDDDDDPEAAY